MIYTVTLNPAVDYSVCAGELVKGDVNRTQSEQIFFGGKGINVSLVLKELGVDSTALGFTAGFTGQAIEDGIAQKGVKTDFVRLSDGFSRINVKIRSEHAITEINGSGPEIPESALEEFFGKLDALVDGDFLVLAGSVPKSLPADIYEKILARISDRSIKTVVDATGELLLKTLKYKPFLIKPNIVELWELFGNCKVNITESAKNLKERGVENVLVSRGSGGAVLVDEHGAIHTRAACKGIEKNFVGAGDSMVAGFIAGCLANPESCDYEYALKLATACGGATAFSDDLCTREEIFALLKTME